jgi:hypothetical protein
MSLKSVLKDPFSAESRWKVRRYLKELKIIGYGSDLDKLARAYGTDKIGAHFYTQHYSRYFAPIRKRRMTILEIGVGGYDDPMEGGESLRMWKRYFPNSQIVGIDLYDKSRLAERRIDTIQCDQTDAAQLTEISRRYGGFDIVIDDGSHLNEHVIRTFQILFLLLKNPGYYVIEDLQTAYWPSWGGFKGTSSMDFLKSLLDGLNYVENPFLGQPTYFDRHITEIAFFHNLCFIRKADNDELPNQPGLIKKEKELLAARAG